MKKSDVFSIATNHTRNIIIKRLVEAKKAAYSDLLDSVGHLHTLHSTGNFNYHLNFLLQNSIVEKEGAVYKLTDKGKDVARFVAEIDQKWLKLEKIVRGENLSIINLAEHFENETGLIMEKEILEFQGSEMIMDEKKIIGILATFDENKLSKKHSKLPIDEFTIKKLKHEQESGVSKSYALLAHPKMEYYLSPKYFGIIQDYVENNFGELEVYAQLEVPAPFIIKAKNKSNKCFFVIAPSFIDKKLLEKIPKKE